MDAQPLRARTTPADFSLVTVIIGLTVTPSEADTPGVAPSEVEPDVREASVAELTRRAVGSKPAPAPLDLVQQLLNTRNLLAGYDLLDVGGSAAAWLALVKGGAS